MFSKRLLYLSTKMLKPFQQKIFFKTKKKYTYILTPNTKFNKTHWNKNLQYIKTHRAVYDTEFWLVLKMFSVHQLSWLQRREMQVSAGAKSELKKKIYLTIFKIYKVYKAFWKHFFLKSSIGSISYKYNLKTINFYFCYI